MDHARDFHKKRKDEVEANPVPKPEDDGYMSEADYIIEGYWGKW